jgi:hypothetical protein
LILLISCAPAPVLRRGITSHKEQTMSLKTIFSIFKHSYLITERREIKISRVFPTCKAAKKARCHYFRIDNGVIIYSRRLKSGLQKYALVGD